MYCALTLIAALTLTSTLCAESPGTLIFSDDFNRVDSVIGKDDLGNGWTTNSELRAPGKKEAAIKNGVVVAGTSEGASHTLGLFHPAGLRDGAIEVKFQIPEQEILDLEFFDFMPPVITICEKDDSSAIFPQIRGITDFGSIRGIDLWKPESVGITKDDDSGHIARARIGRGQLSITDVKTGVFDLENWKRRLASKNDPELAALLKTKTKDVPLPLRANEWHTLRFMIKDDTATASVDGSEIGSFTSLGCAHENKAEIRIDIGKAALIDDVRIWKLK